ncbi:hypothetical protein GCM10025867_06850 [Frondihabitans sucicola]|uniref:DnaJ homologue subfamily C member 28 conserved domain-containing protein n=1 Tax=Frondihabitans sucicola TaxID=1268041 RepID=A0ABM8GJB8_9MICO|nr:DUF1992 domain-containing protein [Frondihabitans sucicola]BDZ48444.1 hypothetical protein GCM10025867_06850 [Frondihabitans sucicola]
MAESDRHHAPDEQGRSDPRRPAPVHRDEVARETARRDPSLAAARYRVERELPADEQKRAPTADELRSIAKTQLDIAIARGDFDNLPGAGKPLPGLTGGTHDPDWWIKAKIEREGLSGVAPPALSLRTENERLDDLLDTMATEASVRATVADFNSRIVEARRQLTGGPPVVTPTRDLDVEVQRWQDRRARHRAEARTAAAELAAEQPPSWRERRRAARAARAGRRPRD